MAIFGMGKKETPEQKAQKQKEADDILELPFFTKMQDGQTQVSPTIAAMIKENPQLFPCDLLKYQRNLSIRIGFRRGNNTEFVAMLGIIALELK